MIGNVIDHFGKFPNPCGNGAQGIYIATAGGQVYNNVSTRNAYAGLQYYDQACNARISNNVFANNTVGLVLYGGNGCSPVGRNTVANNIIVNNVQQAFNNSFSGDQGCSTGNPTLYTNNILFGNGSTFTASPASCTIIQNQMTENPAATFVNYTGNASGDYHLKSGSIANAAGTTRCAAGSTSVRSNPRPGLDSSHQYALARGLRVRGCRRLSFGANGLDRDRPVDKLTTARASAAGFTRTAIRWVRSQGIASRSVAKVTLLGARNLASGGARVIDLISPRNLGNNCCSSDRFTFLTCLVARIVHREVVPKQCPAGGQHAVDFPCNLATRFIA